MITRPILIATVLASLIATSPFSAQAQPREDIERYFRVEFGPQLIARRGFSVEGYVYSTFNYRVSGVRLRVQVLDADGRVVKEGFGWVPGDVPAGGRAYFILPVPERGTDYKVNVVSYFLVSRDAP